MMLGFGFVGMLLFGSALVVLLVGGGALALRQTSGVYLPNRPRQARAHQILSERLARGELTLEEYESLRARIEL